MPKKDKSERPHGDLQADLTFKISPQNDGELTEAVDSENILLKPKIDAEISNFVGLNNSLANDKSEDDEIAEEQAFVDPAIIEEETDLNEDDDYVFNPILYTRSIESDAFYLILSGKVEVCSGNEGFMIMQSSFNYLGADALIRDDYKPDFSAKVINAARILRITRTQYRKAIS